MKRSKIYARALIDALGDALKGQPPGSGVYERTHDELKSVLLIFSHSPQFESALKSVLLTREEKSQLLGKLLTPLALSAVSDQLLRYLVDRNHVHHLRAIWETYQELMVQVQGGAFVVVESAQAWTHEAQEKVKQVFGHSEKKHIYFRWKQNQRLLAGFRLTVDGITYDGSLKNDLNQLGHSLKAKQDALFVKPLEQDSSWR